MLSHCFTSACLSLSLSFHSMGCLLLSANKGKWQVKEKNWNAGSQSYLMKAMIMGKIMIIIMQLLANDDDDANWKIFSAFGYSLQLFSLYGTQTHVGAGLRLNYNGERTLIWKLLVNCCGAAAQTPTLNFEQLQLKKNKARLQSGSAIMAAGWQLAKLLGWLLGSACLASLLAQLN